MTSFVQNIPGYVDALLRAETKADWEVFALEHGLLREQDQSLRPSPGVNIDAIGPVVLTSAVYDGEGAIVTPATMDDRHHVNLRMADSLDWQSIAALFAEAPADTETNASEEASIVNGVALIDPATINTPVRVWAS